LDRGATSRCARLKERWTDERPEQSVVANRCACDEHHDETSRVSEPLSNYVPPQVDWGQPRRRHASLVDPLLVPEAPVTQTRPRRWWRRKESVPGQVIEVKWTELPGPSVPLDAPSAVALGPVSAPATSSALVPFVAKEGPAHRKPGARMALSWGRGSRHAKVTAR